MSIANLAGKPAGKALILKKHVVPPELARTLRAVILALRADGIRRTLGDVLNELADEGAKAFQVWQSHSKDEHAPRNT